MSWQHIRGHDDVAAQFQRALQRGRLASSFLFVGPAGVGKRTFALELAQTLLCQARPAEQMDPCGHCAACAMVLAGNHPDLEIVVKPEDKSFIPLELLIGEREHRRREGLCHNIGLKPYLGGRKVAIIDDADYLNAEGANCLLKTLEEPPPQSVLILIGTSPAKQLPTIRSRCQLIRFGPLPLEAVAELLLAGHLVAEPAEARRLARYSEGSVQRAIELADPGLWAFRNTLYQGLAQPVLESVRLAAATSVFVEEAGKEATARRQRMRQIVAMAAEFYREVLRIVSSANPSDDVELHHLAQEAAQHRRGDGDEAAVCLDQCVETVAQIDRNANQTTLIEAWFDGLAAAQSRRVVAS